MTVLTFVMGLTTLSARKTASLCLLGRLSTYHFPCCLFPPGSAAGTACAWGLPGMIRVLFCATQPKAIPVLAFQRGQEYPSHIQLPVLGGLI